MGFTAEHHLPVLLQSLHRIHDAARLLGEDRTLQGTALCKITTKRGEKSTQLILNGDTGLLVKQSISQQQKHVYAPLSV